jgi:hypothetical protein
MTSAAPFFGANGDMVIRAGQSVVPVVSLIDAQGNPVDVTGRMFFYSIFKGGTEEEVVTRAVLASGTSVSLPAIDGDQTRDLRDGYPAFSLRILIGFYVEGGYSELSEGMLRVLPAPKTLVPQDGDGEPITDLPEEAILTIDESGSRLVSSMRGAPGLPNTLAVGTVTKISAGGTPTASITGNAPNQTVNLGLVTGDTGASGATGATGTTGATGPANTLTVGTVTKIGAGGTPTASITGNAPNQTVNLGLVTGDTGASGATGATGTTGATGPANTLTVGTVTKIGAGGTPTASITGSAPNQTVNLGLVTGDTGASGATGATGTTGATGATGPAGNDANDFAPNFTADGSVLIPAYVAMTLSQGNAPIGTGTLTYAKSTTAAPNTFNTTSLPATLQAGAWLKVIATGVVGLFAAHIRRTA